MKLYYKPGACSLAPHIALYESGLSFTTETVDLVTKKTEKGTDFYTINPKGQVPTLQLNDGSILTENAVILQYIADKSSKNLLPPYGTAERYHAMEWLNFIATELHKGFGPLFYPNTPDEYKAATKTNFTAKFTYLDGVLTKHDYITGNTFTVVDAYLFTVLNWCAFLKIDLSNFAAINAFMARVGSRPLVIETLKAEKLI